MKRLGHRWGLIGLLLATHCDGTTQKAKNDPAALDSAAAAPAPKPVRHTRFVAVVAAKHTASVSAQVEGTLLAVNVRLGDSVKEGDPIASIDDRQLREAVAAAQANSEMRRAEAHMAVLDAGHADLELKRANSLQREGLVTDQSREAASSHYDQAKAKVEQTKAAAREAEALLAQAKSSLSRAIVRAPVDGVVATRFVDPGNEVRHGEPLVRIVAHDAPWIRFGVPANERDSMAVGDEVEFTSVDGKHTIRAQVSHIAPDVDPLSELVVAEARFSGDPDAGVVPGVGGYVSLVGKARPARASLSRAQP